jgi:ATP-dependent Clp protease ATP-binding subunit ClpC
VVERDRELEAMIEVLFRKERRNPILLGERGAGKTAIVEALAQRIADGRVPEELADKRLLAISSELISAAAPNQETFEDLAKAISTVTNSSNLIIFVDGLHGMVLTPKKNAAQEFAGALKFAMQEAQILCIGATTEEEYKAGCAAYPVLEKVFRQLHVKPLDAAGAMAALRARKERLEKFHEVTFTDEALECAVKRADSYLKEKLLPGKALELLDAAGAAVKLRQGAPPQEITDATLKLKSIELRIESAIAAHEFEKAKFYQDEERKERENLAELRKKHGLDDAPALTVGREDVEQVIAKWAAYPYTS